MRLNALVAVLASSGCLTLYGGSRQPVIVNSSPAGAQVFLDGQPVGSAPVEVTVDRGSEPVFRIESDGFEPAVVRPRRRVNGWIAVDLAVGALAFYATAARCWAAARGFSRHRSRCRPRWREWPPPSWTSTPPPRTRSRAASTPSYPRGACPRRQRAPRGRCRPRRAHGSTIMRITIIAVVCIALQGCATMFDRRPGRVLVASTPPGAAVFVDGDPVGTTPTSVRSDAGPIRLESSGSAQRVRLSPEASPWLWAHIPVGLLTGFLGFGLGHCRCDECDLGPKMTPGAFTSLLPTIVDLVRGWAFRYPSRVRVTLSAGHRPARVLRAWPMPPAEIATARARCWR